MGFLSTKLGLSIEQLNNMEHWVPQYPMADSYISITILVVRHFKTNPNMTSNLGGVQTHPTIYSIK